MRATDPIVEGFFSNYSPDFIRSEVERRLGVQRFDSQGDDDMADKADRILEALDKLHGKIDSVDAKHDALCARMDAFEARGTDGKSKTDAAATAVVDTATRNEFAAFQMKCDSAYQALNLGQAPHHVFGESLRDFRIRLLTPLKQYSKAFKDANLALVDDAAAFASLEERIVTDAVEASTSNAANGQPLRKVTRTENGITYTDWYGDPLVAWAPFSGGATRFGSIRVPRDVTW